MESLETASSWVPSLTNADSLSRSAPSSPVQTPVKANG